MISATRACRRPHEAHCLVGEVLAVDDHREDDVGARQRRADDAGLSRLQRPHRVEDMRHAGGAEIERVPRLVDGRVRVTERDDDAALTQARNELGRAGKLGSDGHLGHGAGVEQPVEERRVGIAA